MAAASLLLTLVIAAFFTTPAFCSAVADNGVKLGGEGDNGRGTGLRGLRGPERGADEWFPQVGDNLTRVDWAHAVNDRAFLEAVLASEVMFIEADIVLGRVEGAGEGEAVPVMAHPPAVVSDLSLEAFLAAVAAHNAPLPLGARKGIKLDFKSIEAFEASQSLIAPFTGDQMAYPVWLNADILPGPVAAEGTPVDSARFLRLSAAHARSTLSIGWTTRYGADAGVLSGAYASEHTAAMLATLRAHGVTQRVTYPVRAGLAAGAGARDALLALLGDTADLRATLTVWSSAGDPVDVPALRDLILAAGLDRVYLDVPDELSSVLHLPPADADATDSLREDRRTLV